jgi:hypothetical protein
MSKNKKILILDDDYDVILSFKIIKKWFEVDSYNDPLLALKC